MDLPPARLHATSLEDRVAAMRVQSRWLVPWVFWLVVAGLAIGGIALAAHAINRESDQARIDAKNRATEIRDQLEQLEQQQGLERTIQVVGPDSP